MNKMMAVVLGACLGWTVLPVARAAEPVSPAAETKEQRDARMQWWRDARFGMFVHWGLYSGLAGTWNGKAVATNGGMEWIEQRVKADTDTYAAKALPLFKPTPGFAKEWAKLAKAAGCRYVVFTTKHHEGFGLFDSKAGDYNAGAKIHRDLAKEIVEACHAEGLKVGFYHSVIDWHHDQYAYALSKQLPHPLKGQPYPNGERDHTKYINYLHQQVSELMSNYGPIDVLWWDFSAQDFEGQEAWRAFDLMSMVRAKQPQIIMNNRLFRNEASGWKSMGTDGYTSALDPRYGDFVTPEQHIPSTGMPGVDWETCMTLNTTWGYSEHDHAWKSDETLIRNLIDIASKGGNYLLNIGPKGDGSIPEETIKSMHAIGAWMAKNSESIYATQASPFEKLEWGRCTQKKLADGNTRLYLHIFDWPKDGKLALTGLANKPVKAFLLDGGKELTATSGDNGVTIAVPAEPSDKIATVVALDIKGAPEFIKFDPYADETPAQRDARMQWWRAARFGMFIHWGVYSVPAGTWNGKQIPSIGEWIMNRGKIPCADYQQFAKQFNPVKFNADEWVKTAKDAGMKYIVITSKHHDGFAMFDSKASDWNIVKASPFGRDPLQELAAACRKHGLKLGFYYSQAQDWNNGGSAAGGKWDKAQERSMDDYIDKVAVPQVKEILSHYGEFPAVLWWDTPTDMNKERAEKLIAVLKMKPGIIHNNRLGGGFKGDTETPEQFIPATGYPGRDWETCMTLNDTWGFKSYDNNWKSTETLIKNLCDIASKGGNYLLNVGPTSEGLIPAPSVERLAEVGRWMKVNGEAIYGSSASPFRNLPWGRCTKKVEKAGLFRSGVVTTLYLHVFDWPTNGKLVVPDLTNAVEKAWLLADKKTLETQSAGEGTTIMVPAQAPDPVASVVVVRVKGEVITPPFVAIPEKDGSVLLQAETAALKSAAAACTVGGIKTESYHHRMNIGYWVNPADTAEWPVKASGKFTVTIEASSPRAAQMRLVAGEHVLSLKIAPATGDYKKFKKYTAGTIELTGAAPVKVVLEAVKDGWVPVNVREVRLTPVK